MSEPSTPAVVVLVAEDEMLVRMMACEMLQDGYHVLDARDGQEALAILEARGPSVRALFSDIAMPNLGGLELATIVKEKWPHVGIVLASGHAPPDLRQRIPVGAVFLPKPYREREVTEALERVVREAPRPGPAAT